MKTNENLATAFAGESQANGKYLCFAARQKKRDSAARPVFSVQQPKLKPFTHLLNSGKGRNRHHS